MQSFDFLLPENFYAVNLGMINYIEMENLKKYDPVEHYQMKKNLAECTVLITHERNKAKSLFQFIEEKCPAQLGKYSSYLQSGWQEELSTVLATYGYIPSIEEGMVCNFYPVDIILSPEEEEYPFYFALRLRQLRFHQIDLFLHYQWKESFQKDTSSYHRFLKLLLREFRETLLMEDLIKTVEEWIFLNEQNSFKAEKKNRTTPENGKILCKADQETIQAYFYQLVKFKVLDKASVEHILHYAFAVFEKEVPVRKFTPDQVKKGDLMKFIHHFFTLHSYSRLEAGLWIKLLLLDSLTSFESKEKTETEIIEYIKDNWSKEPALYRFRKV